MEQLAEYINAHDEWTLEVTDIIERNRWKDNTGEEFGVCSDDKQKVEINEQGQAEVITL